MTKVSNLPGTSQPSRKLEIVGRQVVEKVTGLREQQRGSLALTGKQGFFLQREGRGISKRTACARGLDKFLDLEDQHTNFWLEQSFQNELWKERSKGKRWPDWEVASCAGLGSSGDVLIISAHQ